MKQLHSPSRADFVREHTKQKYRHYRCTGSCKTDVVALDGSDLWCGQPGCRGSMKPSNRISSKRLATEQFEQACREGSNPGLTPRFSGVFDSESREVGSSDPAMGEGGLEVPWLGIALVQEQVVSTLLRCASVEWSWSPSVRRTRGNT
jgi:hypothetical protein